MINHRESHNDYIDRLSSGLSWPKKGNIKGVEGEVERVGMAVMWGGEW